MLWIFGDGVNLFKIPISNEGNLAFTSAKEVKIDPKPAKLLTFSDILIFIDQKSSVNIARIVDGYLQYVEKFSADTSLCAAVSPCSSVILTATCKAFCVWKENLASSPHWVVSNTGELPDLSCKKDSPPLLLKETRVKCCITTDGTRGVLALFPARYIAVVELETSRILQLITSCVFFVDIDSFYAGNSYCIGVNQLGGSLVAETLTNGKTVAEWNKLRVFDFRFSGIVAHSRNDLIAIVSSQCSVQFLRLVVPE